MPKKSPSPVVHVYPQLDNHIEAWVVGNVAGLKALKKAINAALKAKKVESAQVFAADGEGYALLVLPVAEEKLGEINLPYYDQEPRPGGRHPFHLVSRMDYIKAVKG